jgi:GWxTD domain-containing protein
MQILRGILLLSFAVSALAQGPKRNQRRADASAFFEAGRLIHTEAVSIAADSGINARALAIFRVAYDALTFLRPGDKQKSEFVATIAVRLELLDSRDVTMARAAWYDTVRVASFQETNQKDNYVTGTQWLEAPPGQYTLVWSIEDGASRQLLKEIRQPLRLRDMQGNPSLSSPIFGYETTITGGFLAQAIGGNADFGKRLIVAYQYHAGTPPTIAHRLVKLGQDSSSIPVKAGTFLRLTAFTLTGGGEIRWRNRRDSTWGVYVMELPGDSMEQGEYALETTLRSGNDSTVLRTPFRVVWSTRPLSMWDLDYSIESMRFLLTDTQLDSLRSGNIEERRQRFNVWWKGRDPSPSTSYNEYQAEYFTRVDYAVRSFVQSPARYESDGSRSDMGKIYILFGKPTHTDRQLLPDQLPQEIWTYSNNVKKRFTFVDDEKSGAFRLITVDELQ